MTGPDLRIIDQDFSNAILSMGKIENAFSSMGRNLVEYLPLTGHLGLSNCMSSFESDWENKRHDLTETLKSYREQLKQVQDTFTQVDNELGKTTPPSGEKPGETTQPPGEKPGGTPPSTPSSGQTPPGSAPPGPSTDGGDIGGAGDVSGVSGGGVGGGDIAGAGDVSGGGGGDVSGVGGGDVSGVGGGDIGGGGNLGGDIGGGDNLGGDIGGGDIGGDGGEPLPNTGTATGPTDSGLNGGSDGALPGQGGSDKLPQTGDGTTAGNPSLDESQYPAVGKMREMLGNAANVSLVSSPDGSLSMKIGSISGLSLAAVAAVLARRGAAGSSRGSTNAFGIVEESSQASASSSAALREALSSINDKDGKALPSGTPGPDRDSILEGLLGDGPEGGDSLKEGDQSLDSRAPGEATDPLGGPEKDASTETADPAISDAGLPETGGLDDDSLSSGLSDPTPLPDSGASLTGGGSSGSLTDGTTAAPDASDVGTPATSSPLNSPLPASSSTATAAAAPKDTSHYSSAPMLSGMGMAAGLGAGSAVHSGNEDKRNEEARRLRDQLSTLKEKD